MLKIEIKFCKIRASGIISLITPMNFRRMFNFFENMLSVVLDKNIANILIVKSLSLRSSLQIVTPDTVGNDPQMAETNLKAHFSSLKTLQSSLGSASFLLVANTCWWQKYTCALKQMFWFMLTSFMKCSIGSTVMFWQCFLL